MLTVKIHKNALKDLNSIPTDYRSGILDACNSMKSDPFSGDVKPLKGMLGIFRRRIGVYRIAFSVNFEDNEVLIIKVGKRDKFYDDL